MLILAIDLGLSNSVFCTLDTQTGVVEFGRVATRSICLRALFAKLHADLVVIESGSLAALVWDVAYELGQRIVVADTTQDAWRWKNVKRKTDQDDALKLARLAAVGQINPVHVPSREVRQWRQLIEQRQTAVQERTRYKNRIRSLVRCGTELVLPRGRGGWTAAARAELAALRKPLSECGPDEQWRGLLDLQLMMLAQLDWLVTQLDQALDRRGAQDERVARLQSIPGVGPRVAEVLVTSLDDPRRFRCGRQVGAYAGLTPRQYQSGQMDRAGRISKRGRTVLRHLLCQAAWQAIRHDARFAAIFTRVCHGQPKRRKVAIVAVMRRLLIVAWAMLRDQTRYRPCRPKPPAPSRTAA